MRDADALSPVIRRGATVRALLGVGLWPVILAQPVTDALAGASWSASVNALAFLALLGTAYAGFGIPLAATVPRWERWALLAVTLAVLVDTAARGAHLARDLSPADAIVPVLTVVLAVVALADRRDLLAGRTSPLHWPLPPGRWQIVEGNGKILNHHWVAPSQRGALDIVGTAPGGRSARPLLPTRLSDYPIYRTPVLAPADATVVVAEDGHPDHPRRGANPAGNHLVLDTGHERLVLAHLSPGTVCVRAGDRVAAGQHLALVGSSGNSTEPHLHIHAVRDGHPLTLAFRRVDSSLRRGAHIRHRPWVETPG
jgi:murein DD-endopeptidase MepM/ murein hydrolase activator NlpD